MEFLLLLGGLFLLAIPTFLLVALVNGGRHTREIKALGSDLSNAFLRLKALEDQAKAPDHKRLGDLEHEIASLRSALSVLSARVDTMNRQAVLDPSSTNTAPATSAPTVEESAPEAPLATPAPDNAQAIPALAIVIPPEHIVLPMSAEALADAHPIALPEIVIDRASDNEGSNPQTTSPAPEGPAPAPKPQPTAKKVSRPPQPARPIEPGPIDKAILAAKNWLFGGNTIVRVGMILVFLGLTFLLRYASSHIVIPLEVRYIGVALTALIALTLGWRLRSKRRDYALLMQGGASAVMYLTIFAALRLHDSPLIPMQAGFALLVAVAVLSTALAVAQNAISLAVAGSLGGFAAPVLVSTGGGSHVALFSYFALLNAGILGTAWFKAWRPLNLIGFFCTFLIGLAWGLRSYDAELHYASSQAFLILFFLMFVTIGLLFARRVLIDDPSVPDSRDAKAWKIWLNQEGHQAQRYVDGTLLFGAPLVGFGLQYGLVRHIEYGSAFSSLALGAFYLLLARLLLRGNTWRCRLLVEVFLALGTIFASLAIPLGLDAQWTTAGWALEAAGIYWVGHRQQRPLARAFALLLQTGALWFFLSDLSRGLDTLLEGSALAALILGLAFLSNMLVLRHHAGVSNTQAAWDSKLAPVFAAIGLWSLYLIPPLLWLSEATAVAWASLGLTTFFIALKRHYPAWFGNALLIQFVALATLASTLEKGDETLLAGNFWIALLLGAVLLADIFLLRRLPPDHAPNKRIEPLLSTLGLWSLYLIPPLRLAGDDTAAAWALAGVATAFIGIRLKTRAWLGNALAVQLLAGLVFLTDLKSGGDLGSVLVASGSGMKGLVIASLIGLALLLSLGVAVRQARAAQQPELVTRFAWMMLFGLLFIALAVLFVLPWSTATAVWAASGLLLIWAGLHLRLKPVVWSALALEIVAGAAFLKTTLPGLVDAAGQLAGDAAAFAHSGFWTPAIIALAAFAVAWRLHHYTRSASTSDLAELGIDGNFLALPALLWSAGWWAFAWYAELSRLDDDHAASKHYFLAIIAVSVLANLLIARRWAWPRLAGLCTALLPLTALVILFDYSHDLPLLDRSGGLAFALALLAQFALLRLTPGVFRADFERALHLVNCWICLAVAAFEMRFLFLELGEPGSVWRWLGWVIPLAAWLLWNSRQHPPGRWPASLYPSLYRYSATAPVVLILLGWMLSANLLSSGDAAPLPYIPLANPLEIGLVLVLFSAWQWLRQVTLIDKSVLSWSFLIKPLQIACIAGAFLTYTGAVMRGVHHLTGRPYTFDALTHSMTAQASLSIAWSLCALGLMIVGHRAGRRRVWIAGAILVAIVVAKLFFVELSSRDSLERIISFIGVGVLLLVVGYFAPLPPKPETVDTTAH